MATCETCGGRKKVLIRVRGKGDVEVTCPECHGSGHVPDKRR